MLLDSAELLVLGGREGGDHPPAAEGKSHRLGAQKSLPALTAEKMTRKR